MASALVPLGPFDDGLDLCCGTGAGLTVLEQVCRGSVTGVDISAGMLEEVAQAAGYGRKARPGHGGPRVALVREANGHAPFPFAAAPSVAPAFDLVVSFGAFGHFLPGRAAGTCSPRSTPYCGAGRAFRVPHRGPGPAGNTRLTGRCWASTR